jgi:hypothetical protein
MEWHVIAHVRVQGPFGPELRNELRQVCATREEALAAAEAWRTKEPVGTSWGSWHPYADGTFGKVATAIRERDAQGLPWVTHYTVTLMLHSA